MQKQFQTKPLKIREHLQRFNTPVHDYQFFLVLQNSCKSNYVETEYIPTHRMHKKGFGPKPPLITNKNFLNVITTSLKCPFTD